MTLNPHCFSLEDSVHEVTEGFVRLNLTSAPVVSQYGKLAGIISEVALIKIFAKDRLLFGNQAKLSDHQKVLDKPSFVQLSEPVTSVLREMLKSQLHRVVVVDSSDRIQGIISPKDVLRSMHGTQSMASMNNRDVLNEAQGKVQEHLSVSGTSELSFYQQLYEKAPYMIHSVAPSGEIMACNRKMHDVLGYLPGMLVGKSIEELYSQEFHEDVKDSLRILVRGGGPITVLSEMKKQDGTLIPVEVQSSVYTDKLGNVEGTISVTRQLEENFSEMLNKDFSDLLSEFEDD